MNILREKLENNKTVIGTHTFLGCEKYLEILGSVNYDFVFICAEHTPYGTDKIYDLVKACENAGTPALVRLPQYDLTFTKKVIDMGVSAVLFPMVHNAEEAKLATDACLYPPYGTRGFGPMGAVKWGCESEKEYLDNNLKGTLRMIQIEHKDAVDDLENIVKNPYIDAYIFGPNDLAGSIGHIGDMYHPESKKLIEKAAEILRLNNKKMGVALVGYSKEDLDYWKGLGVTIFSLDSDSKFLRESAIEAHKRASEMLSE